jgi:hypothetical protein
MSDTPERLNRECLENLNATDDGDPAGNLLNVLKKGFAAMGWAQPSNAADDLISAILPTRNNAQAAPDRISAAAEYLVQTVERKLWDGIRADGRARDNGFEPFHWSQHSFSVNGNARQEDYRDVVREIERLLALSSTHQNTLSRSGNNDGSAKPVLPGPSETLNPRHGGTLSSTQREPFNACLPEDDPNRYEPPAVSSAEGKRPLVSPAEGK